MKTGNAGIIEGDNEVHHIMSDADTMDIVHTITEADKYGVAYVSDFAHSLEGDTTLDTYRNVFDYVQGCIPYRVDPDGRQDIQLPGALYNNRRVDALDNNGEGGTGKGGDCKSMALFIGSCLKALGNYNWRYRFVTQNASNDYHHVYIIAKHGEGYVTLDPTPAAKGFDTEIDWERSMDMAPSHENKPIPTKPRVATNRSGDVDTNTGIGDFHIYLGKSIGATQAQIDETYWKDSQEYMSKNIDKIRDDVKRRMIDGIKFKFAGHPLRRNKTIQALNDKWNEFLRFGSCLIYHWWNDTSIISLSMARGTISNPAPISFPQHLALKKQTADEFKQDLLELGVREGDLLPFCNLSTWNTYGVTLEYMLYRCYCEQEYGQPFRPQPGVPFFRNGTLIANGASIQDSLGIMLCLPAQGGLGRPNSEPYWTTGGFIYSNGASPQMVDIWAGKHPRPGTELEGGAVEPGTIVNNGAGIPETAWNLSVTIYNKWRNGNMVVLPQPEITNKGKKINVQGAHVGDFGISAIISVIVAVVSAVIAITKLVMDIVNSVKTTKNANKLATPPIDFDMMYRTADGGYIAKCTNMDGCDANGQSVQAGGKIKVNPDGSITVNPNMDDPSNQAVDPGNQFGGGFGSKQAWTWGGVAAVAAGALVLMNDKEESRA